MLKRAANCDSFHKMAIRLNESTPGHVKRLGLAGLDLAGVLKRRSLVLNPMLDFFTQANFDILLVKSMKVVHLIYLIFQQYGGFCISA